MKSRPREKYHENGKFQPWMDVSPIKKMGDFPEIFMFSFRGCNPKTTTITSMKVQRTMVILYVCVKVVGEWICEFGLVFCEFGF